MPSGKTGSLFHITVTKELQDQLRPEIHTLKKPPIHISVLLVLQCICAVRDLQLGKVCVVLLATSIWPFPRSAPTLPKKLFFHCLPAARLGWERLSQHLGPLHPSPQELLAIPWCASAASFPGLLTCGLQLHPALPSGPCTGVLLVWKCWPSPPFLRLLFSHPLTFPFLFPS